MEKKTKMKLRLNVTNEESNEKFSLSQEVLDRIPKPGTSIFIIQPYPAVDPSDVDNEEIMEEDIKVKPIMGYSYEPVMVKASVLNDELDEVLVNGNYKLPLYKNSGDPNKKIIALANEEEAIKKYLTLMTVSVNEATRREDLNRNIKESLQESIAKLHH